MKASAEQDRAEFEAWWRGYTKSTKAPRFEGGAYIFPAANTAWNTWQAAPRAPAVPVPQGWKLVPEKGTEAMARAFRADDAPWYFFMTTLRCADFAERYAAMLAAAPQPPEAAQLDDTNVVDIAQAVDLKEAAHVQMPDPVAYQWLETDNFRTSAKSVSGSYWRKLYTEHQVLAILSKHGIKTT